MPPATPSQPENPADGVPREWQPLASGNAALSLRAAAGGAFPATCMEYDFKGGGGFVVARCAAPRPMPEDYEIAFHLRGRGPRNHLELKLVDGSGQNVWRHVYRELRVSRRWKRLRLRAKDFDFAWGPASGAPLDRLGFLEIAVVAGEGGRGALCFTDPTIVDATPTAAARVSASSAMGGYEAEHALGGAGWRPRPEDPHPWLCIDWTAPRTLGGLTIDWLEHTPRHGFRVLSSRDARRWRREYVAPVAGGRRSYVYLPHCTARYLRLDIREPCAGVSIEPQSYRFGRSRNAFWQSVAKTEERGWHPRWLQNEQTLWTPIGTAAGTPSALMNEDGMVEVAPGSWSLEAMLWVEGKLFTWSDVTLRQELREAWMPEPSVVWEARGWRLRIEATVNAAGDTTVSYRLQNRSTEELCARLFVVIRPFQVTPPWQAFRRFGGIAPIRSLALEGQTVCVDDGRRLVPAQSARFGALIFDEGCIAAHLAAGKLPAAQRVEDPQGFACGALLFEASLGSAEEAQFSVEALPAERSGAASTRFDWRAARGCGEWLGAGSMHEAIEAARTSMAYVLLTRAGPALQPGARRYTRSWIRDGAMMAAALLRTGHTHEVRDFIRWYAAHQRADGFVPCCVDEEGPDWLVEHDSHGQLLALIGDYHRFSADDALLAECWGHIERAVQCIEGLLEPSGLMPVSVSHEGYLAQPVHSFWDDFWTVKGLEEAAYVARILGNQSAPRWQGIAERVRRGLAAAIEETRTNRALAYVPGSIEWADFDPTATANALYLFDVPREVNREALQHTFERYLNDWRAKRAGQGAWTNYTPYEIRIIGALVRLGWREAALELLSFFLDDRRPLRWNQWPEIAWRDHRTPGHLGDLPHTWIAAEYVLAVHSLFAFPRDGGLVLAAGVAPQWLDGEGLRVADMATEYGALDYTLQRLDEDTLYFRLGERTAVRVELVPPLDRELAAVSSGGRPHADFDARSVRFSGGPAEALLTLVPRNE